MRKIEVEEANFTIFCVYMGTLRAPGSLHLTDVSRNFTTDFRCTDSADRITRCWLTSERPGNAITCFKNINPVYTSLLSNRCTHIQFVDTIRIIMKYLKLFQHVSDHKGSIIRELYTVSWLKLQ